MTDIKREIKFRCFNKGTGKMIDLYKTTPLALDANLNCDGIFIPFKEGYEIMQFAGHQINNIDLYEGDVIRQEMAGTEGDERLFLVVVWIAEWGMFGGLNIEDGEYEEYLTGGADELDEASFWTFPIEVKSEFATISICGNIYEHPHLLTPQP